MRRLLLLAVPALLAAPLIAQAPTAPPGSRNPAAITGGSYTVDSNHTFVTWTLDHLGFSPLSGMFGEITGALTLDPRNPNAARIDVTIPLAKAATPTAAFTQHLFRPGKDGGKPDFFGASPADARFVSTAVVANGQNAKITGNLTLNGVTRPVTLEASFYGAGKAPERMGGKENVGFRASATIMRSQFGLGYVVPLVGDEVKLDISAAFQKAG